MNINQASGLPSLLTQNNSDLSSKAQTAAATNPLESSSPSKLTITAPVTDLAYWDVAHWQDLDQAGTVFTSLARQYSSLMDKIKTERPDIASQKFDFVTTDSGSLQVVSGTMSKSDQTWLQNQLNSDTGLVAAANKFDSLLVKGYSTDWQQLNPEGQAMTGGDFKQGSDTTYNYKGLADSIAGSVKFLALMNQMDNAANVLKSDSNTLPTSTVITDPYAGAGALAQQFLSANITQNVLGADGQWAANHRIGTIVSDTM